MSRPKWRPKPADARMCSVRLPNPDADDPMACSGSTPCAESRGCDVVTLHRPSGCVDRPYEHIGECGDGANVRLLRPVSSCRCEFIWGYPHREKYAYHRATWRCRELPTD